MRRFGRTSSSPADRADAARERIAHVESEIAALDTSFEVRRAEIATQAAAGVLDDDAAMAALARVDEDERAVARRADHLRRQLAAHREELAQAEHAMAVAGFEQLRAEADAHVHRCVEVSARLDTGLRDAIAAVNDLVAARRAADQALARANASAPAGVPPARWSADEVTWPAARQVQELVRLLELVGSPKAPGASAEQSARARCRSDDEAVEAAVRQRLDGMPLAVLVDAGRVPQGREDEIEERVAAARAAKLARDAAASDVAAYAGTRR